MDFYLKYISILITAFFFRSCSSLSTIKDTRVAVYTPELGATPLIHPARIRLDTPSYSLGVSALETGDTGTWYCRVDGRSNMVTAYNIKVTGEIKKENKKQDRKSTRSPSIVLQTDRQTELLLEVLADLKSFNITAHVHKPRSKNMAQLKCSKTMKIHFNWV